MIFIIYLLNFIENKASQDFQNCCFYCDSESFKASLNLLGEEIRELCKNTKKNKKKQMEHIENLFMS